MDITHIVEQKLDSETLNKFQKLYDCLSSNAEARAKNPEMLAMNRLIAKLFLAKYPSKDIAKQELEGYKARLKYLIDHGSPPYEELPQFRDDVYGEDRKRWYDMKPTTPEDEEVIELQDSDMVPLS